MTKYKEKAYWFVFQEGHLILEKDSLHIPNKDAIARLEDAFTRQLSLGEHRESTHFAAEIKTEYPIPDHLIRLSLKQAFIKNPDWHSLIAKASSAINWDKMHQFCGHCGTKTVHQPPAFERLCPNCHHVFYPRISPSIIVLIQKESKILMARSPHFAAGVYGLIAGFVEIGESIEEAVHREVFEEVGLKIKNLRYFGSQSWPFPDSLMLGFFADHAGGEIHIDNQEIIEAGWFDKNNLPGYPSSSISIAQQLIEAFKRNT